MKAAKESESQRVAMEFEEEELLTAKQLSEFLYYFRLAYALSGRVVGAQSVDAVLSDKAKHIITLQQATAAYTEEALRRRYYEGDLKDQELIINELRKESPLLLVFGGVVSALALAAIISGGEIEASGPGGFAFKFKLPPLGEGLKKLKAVFESEATSRAYEPPPPPDDLLR